MTRQAIQPPGIAVPSAPYSPVAVIGDLVATAGQVAFDESGTIVGDDIRTQTRQALANVERCLDAAGCSLDDVLKVSAFVADLADIEGYNEVYAAVFGALYPARTTVQAVLPPGLLVEIDALASRG